jgi:hypothetical protein
MLIDVIGSNPFSPGSSERIKPAIYLITALLPAEAEVHKRAIILYGCICRSGKTSTEWKIAERQLSIKNSKSKSQEVLNALSCKMLALMLSNFPQ